MWRMSRHHSCLMVSLLILACIAGISLDAARIDVRERRLPNLHTLAVGVLAVTLVSVWTFAGFEATSWLLSALAISTLHFGVALLPGRPLGMGDAKFIAALSPLMSWWQQHFVWLLMSYSTAAIGGLMLQKLSRNSRIPFGPHLIASAMLVVVGQLLRVALAYCR